MRCTMDSSVCLSFFYIIVDRNPSKGLHTIFPLSHTAFTIMRFRVSFFCIMHFLVKLLHTIVLLWLEEVNFYSHDHYAPYSSSY